MALWQPSYQSTTRWATATPRRSKLTAAPVGLFLWRILLQLLVDSLEAVAGAVVDEDYSVTDAIEQMRR